MRPGGAREAGCSRTTPAAAAPSHVCGCCGDETSARPKPRLQNLDARPGGGAERPGSAFRLQKAFGVPRDELADGPESQPCPCCPQASAARSAWSTCPWIVPRLRPPHPRVVSKRRGSFPSEPRARAVISLRISSSTAFLPGESASPSGKGRRLPRGLRHRRPWSLRHPIAGSRKGVTRAHHTNGGGGTRAPAPAGLGSRGRRGRLILQKVFPRARSRTAHAVRLIHG